MVKRDFRFVGSVGVGIPSGEGIRYRVVLIHSKCIVACDRRIVHAGDRNRAVVSAGRGCEYDESHSA